MSDMTQTLSGSVTGATFTERMETLKQLASMTGIRLPQTIIPEGESLIPYGVDRQRALADEIAALPSVSDAAAILRAVRAEQKPIDTMITVNEVRMRATDGGLHGLNCDPNKRALGYTPVAFSQAASFIKPGSVSGGFAQTLLALPPSLRADAFNYFSESASNAERNVVLRSALVPQYRAGALELRRSLQAVVSERYSVVEDHDMIADLSTALPDGAKCRFTQTESRSDLEILWPAMSRELKVGDIALIGIQATNSQTKQCSIRLVPKVLRVLCLNFTTAWGEGAEEEISITHVGEARYKFQRAIRRVLDVVEPFIVAFSDAYQDNLPGKFTRGEMIAKTVKRFELSPKFGETVAASWDMDGTASAGNTRAGLVNAFTRAAQALPMDKAATVEAAAGRIISQGWGAIL